MIQSAPPPPAAIFSPAPTTTATPAASGVKDPEQIARDQFAAFASGTVDKSLYSIDIPQSAIDQLHQALPGLGKIIGVALATHVDVPEGDVYVYKFTCANGSIVEQISFNNGKINGISFKQSPSP
jgi:hypothetical protein